MMKLCLYDCTSFYSEMFHIILQKSARLIYVPIGLQNWLYDESVLSRKEVLTSADYRYALLELER